MIAMNTARRSISYTNNLLYSITFIHAIKALKRGLFGLRPAGPEYPSKKGVFFGPSFRRLKALCL